MQQMGFNPMIEYPTLAPIEILLEDQAGPTITVGETPYDYTISSELPGVAAEDIALRLSNGVLTVTARVETETCQNLSKVLVVDRQYGHVEQGFALPADADTGDIAADFDNGVLRIVIGRVPAAG